MNHLISTRTAVLVAVIVLASAVGASSYLQRDAARTAYAQALDAQSLLASMLDQETGLRGFMITTDEVFLEPYRAGRLRYDQTVSRARRQAADQPNALPSLTVADRTARRWEALATEEIGLLRAGKRSKALSAVNMRERKRRMDAFRAANARYASRVAAEGDRLETRAIYVAILLVAGLGATFALLGLLLTRRATRRIERIHVREQAYEADQRDLVLGLQVTESEEEAQSFLQRHLQRSIPGSEVVVLKRNNSANRLHTGTKLAPGSKLRGHLSELEPRSCLAIRLAQPRHQAADDDSILQCGVCGRLETEATCSPLLVGGEVIGSVLVGHQTPLDELATRAVEDSVKQAAPVLANLRNLALAENRAATDGLTGLPNRRAFEEALKRMVAHANRAMSPMAAVALDLDRFKTINDIHGHAKGDEVLAEVGALLRSLLRDSDFVARVGGEEIMMLLPDTGRDGALVISERVRAAIAAIEISGIDITASLGIAILPEDATDAPNLVRLADRMLYTAKESGRNRVEITQLELEPLPDHLPEPMPT